MWWGQEGRLRTHTVGDLTIQLEGFSCTWVHVCTRVYTCICTCYTHGRTVPAAKSLQSCPTLCDPIDGSLSGSPVPGILQARVLGWSAIAFSGTQS